MTTTQTVIADIGIVADILGKVATVASIAVPGAAVGGVALTKIASVIQGLAAGSQDAAQYVADVQALAASGTDPTPEQWVALNAETDADVAHLEDSTKA